MNIESSKINQTQQVKQNNSSLSQKESDIKFAEELKELEKQTKSSENEEVLKEEEVEKTVTVKEDDSKSDSELKDAIGKLNDVVQNFNQSDDIINSSIKEEEVFDDNKNVINKDFNIQENKDLLPQMNPSMNFGGNGQPFSSFMNNEQSGGSNPSGLTSSAKELAEEAAILSTMAENIAIANKNALLKENVENTETKLPLSKEKTIVNNEGIKKVDSKSAILTEIVVKYDSVIMNQADVEVFANLVEKAEVNLNNLAPKAAERAVSVSKTLADMIAKSMENNQPLRIDFDNNISVIIRISRDGKISADFLPSSQIAEAYLKENLPLLKQRFDENNIKYDELNQRERKENNREKQQKERSQR